LEKVLPQAGRVRTVDYKLVSVGNYGVAVIQRFDRVSQNRVPFISAASLLGMKAGEAGSYKMIADAIRQFGDDVKSDLKELWRRLIFSLLASNYDDHLRNHGFLMRQPGRWSISPAYDVNPMPEIERSRVNKTPITEYNGEPSIEIAVSAASRFGLKTPEAKAILLEVFTAVSAWRESAQQLRLKAATLETYASAFENPHMREAAHMVA
jgi:serine/threonine-protein kinase HipA